MPKVDLYEAMRTLRAVRRLRSDPIPSDVIDRLLAAATWAPTGGNQQPWRIVLVRETSAKQRLGELYAESWSRFSKSYEQRIAQLPADQQGPQRRMLAAGDHLAAHFHAAPAVAVFCFNPKMMAITDAKLPRVSVVGGASIYPAVQNFLLACRAEGLGCVLTTLLCEHEAAVRELLTIPEPWATAAAVPIGYPVLRGHGPIRRRSVEELVFDDRFGDAHERPASTIDDQLLVDRAATLAGEIATRAAEIEQARRIPADLSRAMAAAGFYRMFVPAAVGGLEISPVTGARVFETLARADASAAWVAFIGATSGTALAQIPEATAREVFATPETMIAGVFAPNGKAERAAGGFVAEGRWQWGSGCENAQWILGGCTLYEGGEPMKTEAGTPRRHMLLFPARDVELLDTWHVAGLRGTGSTDFRVRGVFVPEERVLGYLVRETPTRPVYRFPNFTLLALGIGAVALGIARASIEELTSVAAAKKRFGSSSTIASRAHSHLEVAGAEARLRAARAFYYEALEAAWHAANAVEPRAAGADAAIPIELRRDLRLAITNAVNESVKVVDAMYTLAGGVAVYESSRLQRQFRDVHVATQHIMVAPGTLETVGRLFLGVDADTSSL